MNKRNKGKIQKEQKMHHQDPFIHR